MRAKILVLLLVGLFMATSAWAAKIHLKDGTVVSGKVEKVNSKNVEIVTPLGIKTMIPVDTVSSIEYEPGEIIIPESARPERAIEPRQEKVIEPETKAPQAVRETPGLRWQPNLARRSVQYRMIGDVISFGAGITGIYALNSAGDAVAAAQTAKESGSGYWEVERHVEDAKEKAKLNDYLVIGAVVWSLGVALVESKEVEENFKTFTTEGAPSVRKFKRIGEVVDFGGAIVSLCYSALAVSELELENYSKAEKKCRTATTWAVVSLTGVLMEAVADFQYLQAVDQPQSRNDKKDLSLNVRLKEKSPFFVLSYSF